MRSGLRFASMLAAALNSKSFAMGAAFCRLTIPVYILAWVPATNWTGFKYAGRLAECKRLRTLRSIAIWPSKNRCERPFPSCSVQIEQVRAALLPGGLVSGTEQRGDSAQ